MVDRPDNGVSRCQHPLTRGELVDLVRFLSELGKVGPFAVGKSRLVRRWQVLEPTGEARQILRGRDLGAATADDRVLLWNPAYSTVSGVLPLDALLPFGKDSSALAMVRCHLETSTVGKVRLKLNGSKGVALWLDRVAMEMKAELLLDLSPGVHTLTFAVNLAQRGDGLRCELDDVPGSAGRVRIVGGK